MKFRINIIIVLLLFIGNISAQDNKSKNYIGSNIIQLTSSTIELVYENELSYKFGFLITCGFTSDYYHSWAYWHHSICKIYDGYAFEKQAGKFVKIGGKYHFRRNNDKVIYPYLGLNIINSLAYEKAKYDQSISDMSLNEKDIIYIEHNLYIAGIGINLGVSIDIWKLKLDIGFQLSMAILNDNDLYGSFNYVPGMGAKNGCNDFRKNGVITLKYEL